MIRTILIFGIACFLTALLASAFGALVAIMEISLQSREDSAPPARRKTPPDA